MQSVITEAAMCRLTATVVLVYFVVSQAATGFELPDLKGVSCRSTGGFDAALIVIVIIQQASEDLVKIGE